MKKYKIAIPLIIAVLLMFSFISKQKPTYKLIIFEGSDWCSNCIKLEKKILTSSTFTEFLTANHIVIERIDFPQRKKLTPELVTYNESIADKYHFTGTYPTLILVEVVSGKFYSLPHESENLENLINVIQQKIK